MSWITLASQKLGKDFNCKILNGYESFQMGSEKLSVAQRPLIVENKKNRRQLCVIAI